jgi:hypothetical protein
MGSCYTPPYVVAKDWYRCRVCSLSPNGAPRAAKSRMDRTGAMQHLTTLDHARRVRDGRYNRFLAQGQRWALP